MSKQITEAGKQEIQAMITRARIAMDEVESYSQERLDRLCQALAWATSNEKTFTRLAQLGVDESGIGDRAGRPGKRFKIIGKKVLVLLKKILKKAL